MVPVVILTPGLTSRAQHTKCHLRISNRWTDKAKYPPPLHMLIHTSLFAFFPYLVFLFSFLSGMEVCLFFSCLSKRSSCWRREILYCIWPGALLSVISVLLGSPLLRYLLGSIFRLSSLGHGACFRIRSWIWIWIWTCALWEAVLLALLCISHGSYGIWCIRSLGHCMITGGYHHIPIEFTFSLLMWWEFRGCP